uniref:Uncharacterized protein n=1 Tax=Pipistrellus kuhlii TaxID=59472 RepID=A0A7J7V5V1_PIPKU|nr:hypothetical protein mPipKuh1_008563 [Pipistrellus kuhlii]
MAPKGSSKQQSKEDLFLQDFNHKLSAKSSALFFENTFIVSVITIWLHWQIWHKDLIQSAVLQGRGVEEKAPGKEQNGAVQCWNKKKEWTEFLQQDYEWLELMNGKLKIQMEELKQEQQELILMLNWHCPTCIVRTDSIITPESEGNPLLEQLEKK